MNQVFLLAGPTGVGKTSLSLQLAHRIGAEIVSADSMQIYRELDIGTGKIKREEMQGIVHHMLDVVDPSERFSVARYQAMALEKIAEVHSRGKPVILVGGTGLYLNAIYYHMDFHNTVANPERREELVQLGKAKGREALIALLAKIDPMRPDKIDTFNIPRVIRAIEIAEQDRDQKDFAKDLRERTDLDRYLFVLNRPRELLYRSINQRVLNMLEEGWVDEVRRFYPEKVDASSQSMRAIGYREVVQYLSGDLDYDTMVQKIQQGCRNYAKRQLTWFRRYPKAIWLDMEQPSASLDRILNESDDKSQR